MKAQTDAYAAEEAQPVIEPRYVAALSFDDANTDITWLTSHADALDQGGVSASDRVDGCIVSISGQSQRIEPDKARHTIGSVTLKLLDVDGAITAKIKTKLDSDLGLRKKRIVLYKGHRTLTDWADYSKRFTYLVDDIQFRDGVYTLQCSDIQRTTKTRIFTPHQGVLTADISATDLQIPVTIPDPAGKFVTVAHDAVYSANPGTQVGYIKIDDEIIAHSGWTNSSHTHLQVIQRGALNTRAVAHNNPTGVSSSDQNKKVEEYIYLEMPAPKMIYALLTGVLHGQGASLPDHWHLSVPVSYVRLSDFTGIGADLWDTTTNQGRMARFIGLDEVEGKKFIEQELLLWLGAFMPIDADGAYGLRRLQPVLPYSSYSAYIDSEQIISYGELRHDMRRVINNILIKWNWIDTLGRFTKLTQLIDSDSVSKHGDAPQRKYAFKGVFSGVHTDTDLDNYFRQIRDRYAAPPLRLKLTVLPEWDRLEVGDTVRVNCSSIQDYNSGSWLSRVFEVQGVTTNWDTGAVTLDLFGGVEPASWTALSASFVLSDAFYSASGTDLASVLSISNGAVTANGNLPAGRYYYLGDLTINSGATVTVNGHVELRVRGGLTVNGAIDGVGRGKTGAAGALVEFGAEGVAGEVGYPGASIGAVGEHRGINGLYYVSPNRREASATLPAPLNSRNITNPDGLVVNGLPADLSGASGTAGGGAVVKTYDLALGWQKSVDAAGGSGGDSGAGLVIISRGGAFGLSGSIDLSGSDGSLGAVATGAHGVELHAGSGVGGSAGGLMWLIDGAASLPSRNYITLNSGASPVPSVDYLLTGRKTYIKPGNSAAANPIYRQEDQRGTHLVLGYVPRALNGYTWLPEDELQQSTGYDHRPPAWSEIADDGGKPEDNANYVTATSQLTDDAALGATALWPNVSGAGRPEDNADVTANNTAAGIQNQGGLATKNTVGSGEIDPQSVLNNHIKDGETITNVGIETSSNPTVKRIRLNRATGELEFYGDDGSGAIKLLGTMGLSPGGTSDELIEFGVGTGTDRDIMKLITDGLHFKMSSSSRASGPPPGAPGVVALAASFYELWMGRNTFENGSWWEELRGFRGQLLQPVSNTDDSSSSSYVWIGPVLICWGHDRRNSDAAYTINFPRAFTQYPAVIVTRRASGILSPMVATTALSTTSFTVDRENGIDGQQTINWIAIGRGGL